MMNSNLSGDTFRARQEAARRRRYIKMKRRERKIKKIKRMFRLACFIACVGISCYAGEKVIKRKQPVHQEQKVAEKETSIKKKVAKPKSYGNAEIQDAIETLAQSSNKYQKIYDNIEAYPEELLQALCNNADMLDFVLGYPGDGSSKNCKLTKKEKNQPFPLFLQWDKRWGYASYGTSCIGLSGCAPTCMSMVVFALTRNQNATPEEVAEYASENGYYLEGSGTQWSFLSEGASHYGIQARELCLDKGRILNDLEEGHPIICSMRPGDFTTEGHFIVLTGTQDGKIVVNDPNSKARSSSLWEYDTLEKQIKNLWEYTK